MKTFSEFQAYMAGIQHHWPSRTEHPLYRALELVTEAAEFGEKVKKIYRDRDGVPTPEDDLALKKELGDALICLMNAASHFGYSVDEIVTLAHAKMEGRIATKTVQGSGDDRELAATVQDVLVGLGNSLHGKQLAAHIDTLAAARRKPVIDVTSIGGSCPTQAYGSVDGHPLYFRARHGTWRLEISPPDSPDVVAWAAHGDDDTGGCMTNEAVMAILEREGACWAAGIPDSENQNAEVMIFHGNRLRRTVARFDGDRYWASAVDQDGDTIWGRGANLADALTDLCRMLTEAETPDDDTPAEEMLERRRRDVNDDMDAAFARLGKAYADAHDLHDCAQPAAQAILAEDDGWRCPDDIICLARAAATHYGQSVALTTEQMLPHDVWRVVRKALVDKAKRTT